MNPEFCVLDADTSPLPFQAFSIPVKKVIASPPKPGQGHLQHLAIPQRLLRRSTAGLLTSIAKSGTSWLNKTQKHQVFCFINKGKSDNSDIQKRRQVKEIALSGKLRNTFCL
jgi:hypothetical protein